jgi:hypothetical protein
MHYGQQMEFREEYEQGLKLYEAALSERDERGQTLCPPELVATANMGVARCNLRLGRNTYTYLCIYMICIYILCMCMYMCIHIYVYKYIV